MGGNICASHALTHGVQYFSVCPEASGLFPPSVSPIVGIFAEGDQLMPLLVQCRFHHAHVALALDEALARKLLHECPG